MMEGVRLCNECFFYEFTEKCCAKEINMPKKGEKCNFFTPLVTVMFYDDLKDEEVLL